MQPSNSCMYIIISDSLRKANICQSFMQTKLSKKSNQYRLNSMKSSIPSLPLDLYLSHGYMVIKGRTHVVNKNILYRHCVLIENLHSANHRLPLGQNNDSSHFVLSVVHIYNCFYHVSIFFTFPLFNITPNSFQTFI